MRVYTLILFQMPQSRNKLTLEQCMHFDVQRTARILSGLYNLHMRESGITIAQYTLLRNIEALQPVSMSQLAHAVVMDRTSVTRVIAPLLARKLLQASVGEDRRVRNLKLTKKAEALILIAQKSWETAQQEFHDTIGNKQWLELRHALRATVRRVNERAV